MAALARVKIAWSGFQGAPGFTILHFKHFSDEGVSPDQAAAAATTADTFATAVANVLPGGVSIQVQSDVEVLDHNSGELLDILTVPGKTPKTNPGGTGIGLVGPAGAVINWRTSTVRKGRRMRGRMFVVPLAVSRFDSNGTLSQGAIDILVNAGNALIADNANLDFGVWGRPTPILDADGKPTGEHNNDGLFGPVRACNVPDMAAVLRSRRD